MPARKPKPARKKPTKRVVRPWSPRSYVRPGFHRLVADVPLETLRRLSDLQASLREGTRVPPLSHVVRDILVDHLDAIDKDKGRT